MFIDGKWRQALHLEPPQGWLNDPNGLCFFGGYYHVYFQYTPDSAQGNGKKCWGHYRSRNFIEWEFTGTVMFPDIAEDMDGVYSGSAVVCDDTLHIYYTGNVKHSGNYDYVTSGREANVIHVCTKDGINMSRKSVVLKNKDYPEFCSCHVRDPKVWLENGKWNMVLGARTLDDDGCVLFYQSVDLKNWRYVKKDSIDNFGYMWECPDCFEINGYKYLSISPQGLEHTDTDNQNVYSSGYFIYEEKLIGFTEWDKGFDFYAPQTFMAPDGRRILIGWMGIGDIPYFNPTSEIGYQHCLTLPREIVRKNDGVLLQNPINEICMLRKKPIFVADNKPIYTELPFDMVSTVDNEFTIVIDKAVELSWDKALFTLKFIDKDAACGRTVRKARLEECSSIRIIADKSSLEIYLNGGRVVLSTRIYPRHEKVEINTKGIAPIIYPLKGMEVKYLGE